MALTTTFNTGAKGITNDVRAFIKSKVDFDCLTARRVPGIGNVLYMKDKAGINMGYVYKEQGTVKVQIKNLFLK